MTERTGKSLRPGVRYSFLKILTGSDLSRRRLAVMTATASKPGPTLWLTACAHGDEVGGVVVIQEVFRRLKRKPLLCGEVRAFPLMNPLGFEVGTRHISIGGEDLNRSFPGNPNGSLAHRIAATIFDEIIQTQPALVLDLHNDWRNSIPYAVIDPQRSTAHREAFAQARRFARTTGLPLVEESNSVSETMVSRRTLSGSLLRSDIAAITLELGEAYVVNEVNVDHGVRAIWNVLSELGMAAAQDQPFEFELHRDCRRRFLAYSDGALSSTSGIIRFLVKPGDLIENGQPVAKVYNAFGKLLETVVSAHRGIVLGHSDSSVAFPGVPVVALGVLKPPGRKTPTTGRPVQP